MSLERLGHYSIVRLLGVGGMGEVYLAEDTKLRRQVALKVLPAAFSGDSERLARMRREARTLASLTHPHIAAIYGLEDSGDTHALVMELADGPTLAELIDRGPIVVDDALRNARQLADALEYAHERGVIHRDLKPANIKVCDGAVKVLDFGIATVLEQSASAERARVPTLTHLTQEGTVLGTPAYMSPEQAKGATVDRRTDIWAFGCVLYEMLTGANAFAGGTSTETLAAVLKSEPDWSKLPAATPSRVRSLLKRCLEKDPRLRLQAMGEARIALDDTLGGVVDELPSTRRRMSALFASAAAVAAALVGFGVWELKPTPSAPPPPVTRFTIFLPPDQELTGVALSRDGRELAYAAATSGGKPQLFVRPLDGVDARSIPGTEGAAGPIFSPDGESIAFFASGSLKRVAIEGGGVQLIAITTRAFEAEAAWGERGAIAFAAQLSGLWSVPEQGGSPKMLTHLVNGETEHLSPEFLPGGRAVLFATVGPSRTGIAVESSDNGSRHEIMSGEGLSSPRLASSGHLIVAQAGGLVAAPFDTARLTLSGTPLRVVDDVAIGSNGVAQYALSANGSLAYALGVAQSNRHRLVWVARDGTEQALPVPPGRYNQPRVSPDGRRIAVDVAEGTAAVKPWQVWLYDLERDTFAPATFGDNNRHAVFAPDGARMVFMSIREGKAQVFSQLVDGTGGAQQLTTVSAAPDVLAIPYSWSPDGLLAFVTVTPAGEGDTWLQPVPSAATTATHSLPSVAGSAEQSTPAQHLFRSRLDDGVPQFSPDGHWLAYASEESGNFEIYVRPFPDSGGKWQVSVDGGTEPQWNHNGRELFYRTGEKMMAVEIDTRAGFVHGKPKTLFEGHYAQSLAAGWVNRANYDVSPDGRRFLMLAPVDSGRTAPNRIEVVLNWTEELKRLAPAAKK